MAEYMNRRKARAPLIAHRREQRDEGCVHTLTVSNPKRLNVLTSTMMDELREAVDEHTRDPDARVLLLRGAGADAWIGGTDSEEMAGLDAGTALILARKLRDLCRSLRRAPVPVIAVIRGYCVGPGLELAASCDLRMAANDASFGLPDVYAGIPAVAGAAFLPLIIGVGRTRELALTGRIVDARTAHNWGLLEGIGPPGPVLEGLVEARVSEILTGAPEAVRLQKRLCRLWEERPLKESMDLGMKAFSKAFSGGEPAEYFRRRGAGKDPES
jgi:enoyl-CoA hydratase/carnithine racemase